jgi:hypothetical protein
MQFPDDYPFIDTNVFALQYHIRLYRKDGKLKLEALSEPMTIESKEQYLKLDMYGPIFARIHIYLDGVERDFKILRPVLKKLGHELRSFFEQNIISYVKKL